jgi:hypothetical protein
MDARDHISDHAIAYGAPIYLNPAARWLCVVGAVGVPDAGGQNGLSSGQSWADYCIFDSDLCHVTYMRCAYNGAKIAARARAAHMPQALMRRP